MKLKDKSRKIADAKASITTKRSLSAHVATVDPIDVVNSSPELLRQVSANGYHEYRELCRKQTGTALYCLTKTIQDSLKSDDIALRGLGVKAATILIEHGWGRPVQAVAVAEVKTENNEIVALSREKLEAIARAVMPDAVAEAEAASENGVIEVVEDDFEPYT